jgi:hypothetical protein
VPIDRTILATCIQGHGGFPKGTALKFKKGPPRNFTDGKGPAPYFGVLTNAEDSGKGLQ